MTTYVEESLLLVFMYSPLKIFSIPLLFVLSLASHLTISQIFLKVTLIFRRDMDCYFIFGKAPTTALSHEVLQIDGSLSYSAEAKALKMFTNL